MTQTILNLEDYSPLILRGKPLTKLRGKNPIVYTHSRIATKLQLLKQLVMLTGNKLKLYNLQSLASYCVLL